MVIDDPFDALDTETARLERFFTGLDDAGWSEPSRCPGWDRRAILAHLVGIEDYVRAGLDDRVAEFARESGTPMPYQDFNEFKVAQVIDVPTPDLLNRWREATARNHAELRRRGADSRIDTHAGSYPLGRQTWYFATESAIHADDVDAPVPDEEEQERREWRARFAVDALREADRGVSVERLGDRFEVAAVGETAELSDVDLIEAASGRLAEGMLPERLRQNLVVFA
ncbi:uncharacterized protein (TIGR03083 family) [Stackebrandtia albiflava]|uniref:Uncharacterized protein (TIGR03083 family) n=1 Tax=Stackebrandtia albiflava TaxID=406432 RepID=A0A562VBC4_9ACTN|nr:maleylpyruvate isomerase family mycothiol-dependent enzyme [Stackebrandtia albiflava]TWJ15184.1 uncharacterized protein (TIGR03083 family) [Stackebrandtia albiflava]